MTALDSTLKHVIDKAKQKYAPVCCLGLRMKFKTLFYPAFGRNKHTAVPIPSFWFPIILIAFNASIIWPNNYWPLTGGGGGWLSLLSVFKLLLQAASKNLSYCKNFMKNLLNVTVSSSWSKFTLANLHEPQLKLINKFGNLNNDFSLLFLSKALIELRKMLLRKQGYAPVWSRAWNLKPFVTRPVFGRHIKTQPFHHFDFQLFW